MDPTEPPPEATRCRCGRPPLRSMSLPPAAPACALLALIAAVRADWPPMFVWLGIALFIDGVDGTFARRLRVADVLPRWSGDVLDLVVDILTYVFVPAYAHRRKRAVAASRRDAARHRHRRDRLALFRRPADEDVGLLFSRLSGAVERGGVLSVPAQARAVARRGRGRGACGADFRAVSRRPSDADRALARADDRGADRCGRCLPTFAVARQSRSPAFWTVAGLCLLAIYFVGVGFLRRHHP